MGDFKIRGPLAAAAQIGAAVSVSEKLGALGLVWASHFRSAPISAPQRADPVGSFRAISGRIVTVSSHHQGIANTAESLGGLPKTYFMHDQDVDTLLFSIIEAHAQIREARDQYCGISDDDAPTKAVAEAQ